MKVWIVSPIVDNNLGDPECAFDTEEKARAWVEDQKGCWREFEITEFVVE